jgi:hypothetical protein
MMLTNPVGSGLDAATAIAGVAGLGTLAECT